MAYSSAAPITSLIDEINTLVGTALDGVAGTITTDITPLVSACFGIYIILITVNYMRGAESEPVLDFGMRMASWAVVIGIGLNEANYSSAIQPIVTGLGNNLATAISGGSVDAGALDTLAIQYLEIIFKGFEEAGKVLNPATALGSYFLAALKSVIIVIGLVPFLVAATVVIIVANVGSQIVAAIAPIFFAFLLFPATRQYFSAWLNTALSYAFIPIMVAVIAAISVGLSKKMLGITSTTPLADVPFSDVFYASIGNLILLFLLKQVSALASSLSAGGINASMPGGIGSLASFIRQSAKQNVSDRRDGLPHVSPKAIKGYASEKYSNLRNKFNSIRKAG